MNGVPEMFEKGNDVMARNIGGRRIGAVRGRTQFQLPNGLWAKRNRATGAIIAVKKDGEPFKGVVRERSITSLDPERRAASTHQ